MSRPTARTGVRTAVVGTGLIGGSVLLRLHEAGVDVTGWDPDERTRRHGRDRGVRFTDDLAAAVRDRDLVFLCGPLSTLPDTLVEVAAVTGSHCLITDVGSTKSAVADRARRAGLSHRFVPGHPMAGAERAGLTAAVPTLYDGAAWVLCPPLEGPLEPFRLLASVIIEVFEARIVPMTPAEHDAVAALASHIPHLLAGGLAGAVAGSPLRDAVLALAAGSFRDGTRVAGTPSARTVDMLMNNREFVLRQVESVEGVLTDLIAALRDDDPGRLAEHYTRANLLRRDLVSRPVAVSTATFPLDGPPETEVEFLLGLGRRGGHLTACGTDESKVTYVIGQPEAVIAA